MIDLVSIDLGKDGAVAIWEKGKVIDVIPWQFDDGKYECENVLATIQLLKHTIPKGCKCAVEKPGRRLHIQWMLFLDLRYVCDEQESELFPYSPPQIKKAAAGYGRADKDDMEKAAVKSKVCSKSLLKNEHCVDCVCIGLTHIRLQK